jgi:hypothetical protein
MTAPHRSWTAVNLKVVHLEASELPRSVMMERTILEVVRLCIRLCATTALAHRPCFPLILQDGAAVMGLAVAAVALAATSATGNPVYDAIGSIGVGVLLGGVSTDGVGMACICL